MLSSKQRTFFSFKHKLFLSYLVLISFILSLVLITSYNSAKNTILTIYNQTTHETIEQINYTLTAVIDTIVERLNTLSINETVKNFILKYTDMTQEDYWNASTYDYTFLQDINHIKSFLAKSSYVYNTEDTSIFLINPQGVAFAPWGIHENSFLPIIEQAQDYLKHSCSSLYWIIDNATLIDPYYLTDSDASNYLGCLKPILIDNVFVGYILIGFNEYSLAKSFEPFITNKPNHAMVLSDAEGHMITAIQNELPLNQLQPTSSHNYIITQTKLKTANWNLTYIDSQKNITQTINTNYLNLCSILLGIYLCTLLLSNLLAFNLTKRIRTLQQVMHLTNCSLPTALPPDGSYDEISTLITAYNQMVSSVHHYTEQLLKEQTKKRELELNFLKVQINSHFLYNTLNSVKILARLHRFEEINTLITSLIGLLKATSCKHELIPLSKEFEFLRNYINIQNIRYLSSVELHINCPEALLQSPIPNLILQPLIENAMLHGFQDMSNSCSIHITVSEINQYLVIKIKDNGQGFIPNSRKKDSLNGIGITNVKERLAIHYGKNHEFQIFSEPLKGTCVYIAFKL